MSKKKNNQTKAEAATPYATGVVAGTAAIGAGGVGLASQQALEAVEQARVEAETQLESQTTTFLEESSNRLESETENHQLVLRQTVDELVAEANQQIQNAAEQIIHSARAEIMRIQQESEDSIHRLANDTELELLEQKDRMLAEIHQASQRAGDDIHLLADDARSQTDGMVRQLANEVEGGRSHLEQTVEQALARIETQAEARIADITSLDGPFRIDPGAGTSEDDIEIG